MGLRPTERFSDRAEAYARHRPDYPEACVAYLCERCRWRPGARIADLGSGTGLFARRLLEAGLEVAGVEPNAAMRREGEALLAPYGRFESLGTEAERTGLPDRSVEGATAAQAFHWFDRAAVRRELLRILRPGGRVALIWNARRTRTPFLRAYEAHLREHGVRYAEINHAGLPEEVFRRFYGHGDFGPRVFDNAQVLDRDGLFGRHFSSSYVPGPDHPGHAAARADLERVFAAHSEGGLVTIEYDTKVYCGRLAEPPFEAADGAE